MERRRGGEAHGDAADLAARGAARAGLGALDVGQDRLGVGQEGAAGVGQAHAARMAHEQRGVDLALERLDLLAERRLLHVELLGRARDVALAGDGDEVAEMAQFHGILLDAAQPAHGHDRLEAGGPDMNKYANPFIIYLKCAHLATMLRHVATGAPP